MLFAQKKSGEVTLIIDIGSSSVGAAIVLASHGVPPKILFSTRQKAPLQNETERSRSVASVVQTLELVMKAVMTERQAIHKTHIIFSSPWYLSKTQILDISHETPTLITRRAVEQLTKVAEEKLIAESHSSGEIVERRVIRARLNGYDTPDPYNKKAKKAEVVFFASIVPKDILESVKRVVEKHYHLRNNQISSFSLVAWSALSGLMPDESDFLIVDVRGEVTDVSLVQNGALIKSAAFAQGKNNLVRSVAAGSGETPAAALSSISTSLHGQAEPAAKSKVESLSQNFKQEWKTAYEKTLQELTAGATPFKTFLLADGDIDVFFEDILNEMKKDAVLHPLRHVDVRKYVETSSVLTDPFLALESIFVTMV